MRVPKVSEEHRTRRRDEILSAARRCFARYGYEGATVKRLEAETGLSRGAIFNYFASKDDIFLELVERDQERFGRVWLEGGFEAALRGVLAEDPEWIGVYLETGRRLRTDEEFRRRRFDAGSEIRERLSAWIAAAQVDGHLRDDVSVETMGELLGVLIDGLAIRSAVGLPLPDADALIALIIVIIRAPADTPARRSSGSRAPRRRSASSR